MDSMDRLFQNLSPSQHNVTSNSHETLASLTEELIHCGLDVDLLRLHAECILQAVSTNHRPSFQIVDTCRLENGGVLKPSPLPDTEVGTKDPAQGFVAFVPAAGAASRYSQPFQPLMEALVKANPQDVEDAIDMLLSLGADAWPLPAQLATLLRDRGRAQTLSSADMLLLAEQLQLPKALMPCVTEGDSFLALKLEEHRALKGLHGQVYICPANMESHFQKVIEETGRRIPPDCDRVTPAPPTHIIAQGPTLSTIRFNRDGTPFVDQDGRCSPVPAGHGALIELLPVVRRKFPHAHSVFIRNIDNVVGTKDDATHATHAFLQFHSAVLEAVRSIRQALAASDLDGAAGAAEPLKAYIGPYAKPPGFAHEALLAALDDRGARLLWDIQVRLFHSPLPADLNLRTLTDAYSRPVNTLGQVPNTGKDIGGTPCFIQVGETQVKVCIEVPHVSEQDKTSFLSNPEKATYFNPVFVAAELVEDKDLPRLREHSFWILSEKIHKGHPVVYFETVLYELLGNSHLANCTFVEVPRSVFNPHKSVQDASGRTRNHWLTSSL